MRQELVNRLRRSFRDPRWGVVGAVVVVAVVAWVLTHDGGQRRQPTEPPGFSVFPEGDEVPRLTPIKITFASAPSEREPEKLLQLEPHAPGQYAWLSERTVLFQPDFPGLLRGATYTVKVPARPETGLEVDLAKQFTTSGLLTVIQAVPSNGDTDVPADVQVMVQFSRSVAPLTMLSEARKDPVIAFEPPLEGTGEWLNTSIYRFVPSGLAPNTTYRARIAAGLTSAADGVLKEDYTWSFTTYGPALVSVTPDRNTQFAAPRQTITLKFNQAMDRSSVEAGFRLESKESGVVGGSFAWSDGDATVAFTPAAQLARQTTYTLLVPKGLKGARGGATATEWTSSFTTIGLPAVSVTQPANGATNAERYGIRISFATPMDEDSFEGRVTVSGVPADQLNVGFDSYGGRDLFLNAPLKPSTPYVVTLAAGAADRYGQAMSAYTFSFTTGALPSSVSLALPVYGSMATYSASAEPVLYFHVTNLPSASFTLYPLTASEAALFLKNTPPGPPGPNVPWTPSQPAIRRWTVPVNGGLNEVVLGSTSLSGGGPLPKGDYWLTSSGQLFSSFAFSVIDSVLVAKVAQDELVVWALDHDTGKPVSNATVKYESLPEPKFGGVETPAVKRDEGKTDANGLVSFPLARQTALTFGGPRGYVATLDDAGHRGRANTQWQQGIAPYQLNLPLDYFVREFVGQVYTDRTIYRPGESVEYRGIIRRDDDAQYLVPESTPPLTVVVRNSQGKELKREGVTLNEFGTFAGTVPLPSDALVGDYFITVETSDTNRTGIQAGSARFLVAEFRKPEFQVTVEAGRPAYVNGEAIGVKATASFFFGGGVAGAPVEWSVLSSPYSVQVKGFERYSFSDYDYWRPFVFERPVRASGKAVTGPDGVASFDVPAVLTGNESAQLYTVSATVTDQNAQASAASTSVTVHPADHYAGIRPANYVATTGEEARIDLVTVDTDGAIVTNSPVTVKVYEREWITTKERTPEGARRYRSEPKDTLVTTLSTTTNSEGKGSVVYTAKKPGTLRLVAEVTDKKGRTARSATYLWVSGTAYASWQVTNDDTIKLVADKDRYNVGDTAEVLVPAPFTGASGLVTVERGKVITRSVQSFPTNSERIRVPIVDRSVPNIYVSVVLYRPPTSDDPVPRYKVGYVELPVSTSTRVLTVDIRPDREQAKPGETVHYDITVVDSNNKGVKAEVSVAVVDKALFSLEPDRGPDGLKSFWYERGLGVQTSSSLAVSVNRANDVISEPPSGGKGGGGFEDERLRQDFRNTAYWRAQLATNDAGKASVDVAMPDNLTTWRMKVVAVSGSTQVGEATNELVSTQPLLLRPALPRFLRVGDSVGLRLLVRNATQNESNVKVSLEADGVELTGDDSLTKKVPAGESVIYEWPAKVIVEGSAKLTFSASGSGGLKDAVLQELPTYLDVTPETMATGGVVAGEALSEAIYLPAYAILKVGSLAVAVQPSLSGSVASELIEFEPRFPETYRTQDTITIADRLAATLGVRRAAKSAGQSTDGHDKAIDRDFTSLVGRQRPNGGWPWCNDPLCDTDINVTGIVLGALGEARRDGRSVDASVLSRATGYVSAYLDRTTDVAHPADPNQNAFLIAALAAAGNSDIALSRARALFEGYRGQLKNWGRAYLILAMTEAGLTKDDAKLGGLLNDLAGATIPSANGNHWEDERTPGSFITNTATTGLVLEALVRAYPAHPLTPQTVRWLVVARGERKWFTSVERSRAILALSEYAAMTGELGGDYSYSVTLDNRDVLRGRFKPVDGNKTDAKSLPLTSFSPGKVSILSFVRDFAKQGRMYYTLNLRYVTPAQGVEALSRGFAVSHEYTLLNDPSKRVDTVKLGETVRVKLTVMVPAERDYVVVNDFLPAGLEPIDPRLQNVDVKLKAQLDAERTKAFAEKHEGYFAPWFHWYYNPWQHVDTRDDRVTLSASRLEKGVYEYIYYARATSVGDFFVAPAHAEESLFPDVFGRSDSSRLRVEP